jgi:Domain of unknown function (DUF4340)
VVAPARLRSWGWPVAAIIAAGFIGLLAFYGDRPEPGLARFIPAGLLADWPVQQVMSVDVATGAQNRSFRRYPGGGWRSAAAGEPATADLAQRIETGLTLLHNSAPQRTDLSSAQLEEFGLEPPRLTVTARMTGRTDVTIEFGGANPLGLERYARVVGRNEIMLMPAFVADAWEKVAEAR